MKKLLVISILFLFGCKSNPVSPQDSNSLPATFTGAFHWYYHDTGLPDDTLEKESPEHCTFTVTEADSVFHSYEIITGKSLRFEWDGIKGDSAFDLSTYPGTKASYDGATLILNVPSFQYRSGRGIDKIFKATR